MNKRRARVTLHSCLTPHFDQGCDTNVGSHICDTNVGSHICDTRVGSHIFIYMYIVVYEDYEPRQCVPFRITVKSVSFKSLDYRRHRVRACTIARLVSQLGHINFKANTAIESIDKHLSLSQKRGWGYSDRSTEKYTIDLHH